MIPERTRYRPPTADEIAADLAAIVPAHERPHAGEPAWTGGRHDEASCTTCTPPLGSPPWRRGAERASVHQEFLPMSSAGSEPRPGRDGYDLEATS